MQCDKLYTGTDREHSQFVLVSLHPQRALHPSSQPLTNIYFFLSALFFSLFSAFTFRDTQDFPGLSDDFYGSKSLSKCVVILIKQLSLEIKMAVPHTQRSLSLTLFHSHSLSLLLSLPHQPPLPN